jgi:hypothetical protein
LPGDSDLLVEVLIALVAAVQSVFVRLTNCDRMAHVLTPLWSEYWRMAVHRGQHFDSSIFEREAQGRLT